MGSKARQALGLCLRFSSTQRHDRTRRWIETAVDGEIGRQGLPMLAHMPPSATCRGTQEANVRPIRMSAFASPGADTPRAGLRRPVLPETGFDRGRIVGLSPLARPLDRNSGRDFHQERPGAGLRIRRWQRFRGPDVIAVRREADAELLALYGVPREARELAIAERPLQLNDAGRSGRAGSSRSPESLRFRRAIKTPTRHIPPLRGRWTGQRAVSLITTAPSATR